MYGTVVWTCKCNNFQAVVFNLRNRKLKTAYLFWNIVSKVDKLANQFMLKMLHWKTKRFIDARWSMLFKVIIIFHVSHSKESYDSEHKMDQVYKVKSCYLQLLNSVRVCILTWRTRAPQTCTHHFDWFFAWRSFCCPFVTFQLRKCYYQNKKHYKKHTGYHQSNADVIWYFALKPEIAGDS